PERQLRPLEAPQIAPVLRVRVARATARRGLQVAPRDAEPAPDPRRLDRAVRRRREHVIERRAHVVLALPPAHPPHPDVLLARAHRPQMHEAHLRIVDRLRDPPVHAAEVPVDAIPGHLAHEASDLAEALHAVELRGADGVLVARALLPQPPIGLALEALAAEVTEVSVRLHPLHRPLEVARAELEVAVELADVIALVEVHAREAIVERLDHAGADRARPSV